MSPADVVHIAGVMVATEVRTLVDLARARDAVNVDAARAMAFHHPGLVDRALAWLAASGPVRDKRRAAAVLKTLRTAGQDDVTR